MSLVPELARHDAVTGAGLRVAGETGWVAAGTCWMGVAVTLRSDSGENRYLGHAATRPMA